jgi:hypothetical protein
MAARLTSQLQVRQQGGRRSAHAALRLRRNCVVARAHVPPLHNAGDADLNLRLQPTRCMCGAQLAPALCASANSFSGIANVVLGSKWLFRLPGLAEHKNPTAPNVNSNRKCQCTWFS